jgi:hypothetical protein
MPGTVARPLIPAIVLGWDGVPSAISGLEESAGSPMDVIQHTGQLSNEHFHPSLGGKLDPNNRWVLLHRLIPWIQLESHHAPGFSAKTGATAKPFPMVVGAVGRAWSAEPL